MRIMISYGLSVDKRAPSGANEYELNGGIMNISRSQAIGITVAVLAVFAAFGGGRYTALNPVDSGDKVVDAINALPPTSFGEPSLEGTIATGRVAGVFVELGRDLYLSVDKAPGNLRNSGRRFVEVEFPESLRKDRNVTSSIIRNVGVNIEVGDLVEVKFVDKENTVGNDHVTRVTQLVARKDSDLAKNYEQRILVRKFAPNSMTASVNHDAGAVDRFISQKSAGETGGQQNAASVR
jgi:hypothetical protein